MAALESRSGDSHGIFLQSQLPLFKCAGLSSHGAAPQNLLWEMLHAHAPHTERGLATEERAGTLTTRDLPSCVPLRVCRGPPGLFGLRKLAVLVIFASEVSVQV